MRFLASLLVAASSIGGSWAQYDDGYENVTTSTTPVQIRLAYQGPTAMMVSWNTFAQLPSPSVSYGVSSDALTLTASSSVSVTYATSLTYNNHVNITGLLPFTTYYYLPQHSNATTPYSFTTARVAGDSSPYTVGVVIDLGTMGALGLSDVVGAGAANPLRVNEQTTITAVAEMIDNYEFMVHAGDIAYADYWLKEEIQNYLPTTTSEQGAAVYESILNAFYDEMVGITSKKAYMVNVGNHEANCDNGGTTNKTSGEAYTESICLAGQTNFTGYINHWRMPSGPSGGLGNMWYSYDYGMAHFIHIDTETDLGNGLVGPDEDSPEFGGPFGSFNQQIDWLTSDLASINRTLTPWVIVFGHRGWYLSASSSVCANCQTAFEDLLYEWGVDVYINGHAHIYERAAPTFNNIVDPNGLNNPTAPLYITNGAAGHYDGLDPFTAIQPYSVFRQAADYCWTTISFTNKTHITVDTLWSANNTVLDSAVLFKAHNNSLPVTISTSPTSTSTASSATPSSTNFNGQGHLYVYTNGQNEGDIGSADTWYNAPGQNTATYTAVPVSNNGSFTLQHSSDYCTIGSDFSFGCNSDATDATVFDQTPDGNLTFNGSDSWYASSVASSGARPTVYATVLPVSMNIVWGVHGPPLSNAPTLTSTPSTSSATSGPPTVTVTVTVTPDCTNTTPTSTTTSPPLVCNANNCLRALRNSKFSSSASKFCETYTTTLNTATTAIPTYLANCNGVPSAVSSACTCFMTAAT